MEPRIQYAQTADGAKFGFEAKMWSAADKLRRNMDAAESKHVGLGLMLASTQLHPYVGST